ncbi:peptidoglycan-binding domain-containing protein [Kitasatospora sp. NPDC093806]|uniref:peptidoglycan-binding domain-containing protein n=1 Tax=Kitasatospora sp. NPDC093806 TaxID=3155075 RepID=UPI00342A51A7
MKIARKLATAAVTIGMAMTAVIGTTTAADASPRAPYVGYGYAEYGSGVWCVQHLLNHNGEYYGGVSEDSYWGPKTEAAVKGFQNYLKQSGRSPRIAVDGIVGQDTGWWLLYLNKDGYGYGNGSNGYCWNYVPSSF